MNEDFQVYGQIYKKKRTFPVKKLNIFQNIVACLYSKDQSTSKVLQCLLASKARNSMFCQFTLFTIGVVPVALNG